MTKATMQCHMCRAEVPVSAHIQHMRILDVMIEAEVEGYEDFFVHAVGPGDEFDEEGNVAVCDHCLVEELANDIQLAGHVDHDEWAHPSGRFNPA